MSPMWLVVGLLLLLAAILIGSADGHSTTAAGATTTGPLSVALTSRVKGQPGSTLTLRCGHGMTLPPAVPEPLDRGVVQLWHTPFGTLRDPPGIHYSRRTPSIHLQPLIRGRVTGSTAPPPESSRRLPVSVQHDGSLLVSNASHHHSGLYYCLLQDGLGITIHPYQIHTDDDDDEKVHEEKSRDAGRRDDDIRRSPVSGPRTGRLFQLGELSMGLSTGDPTERAARQREGNGRWRRAIRVDKDVVGSNGEKEEEGAAISVGHLAGAVVASVLVTFVVGFSAGALSRVYVLRCVNAVTARARSRRRPPAPDATDRGCGVTMATLPGMHNDSGMSRDEERGGGGDDSEAWDTTLESTASTSPAPPDKPQRSFRQKRVDAQRETTAYLERCDRTAAHQEEEETMGTEGRKDKEEEQEEGAKAGGGGAKTLSGQGELQEPEQPSSESEQPTSETDEGRGSEVGEEAEDRGGDRVGEAQIRGGEVGEEKGGGDTVGEAEQQREEEEEEKASSGAVVSEADEEELGGSISDDEPSSSDGDSESGRSSSDSHEDVAQETQEERTTTSSDERCEAAPPDNLPRPAARRRSRVIRLYQYDEEGRRYGHLLPDRVPDDDGGEELGPAPKPKLRSLSLTRLNAIMAAASAGPLDTPPPGTTTRDEREDDGRSPSPPTTPMKSPVFHMDI